ncbi:MAG TPA: DUF1905 domain-containing protein [Chitinophagales bacterium]|nr:DUF1905 domain-containing protein [Saprospiraceae bacterium]HMX04993.1 DUF1905 domain-containing protein [Chitinophagales bacterium]HNA57428.1 DUF1905 domain-containing protein [Chitinophagales bacterium]HNF70636.1 DUF1905 domain-containing protein [Chitinophagales bacterium]HNI55397.1 DUF1905 domain-containing protein [Chitinophagales bacterium]
MAFKGVPFSFKAVPWQYQGQGAWVFVDLPKDTANEIRSIFKNEEQGWGRLQITAKIGNTEWKSAIWYDTKRKTYLLPLKAEIRNKEAVEIGVECAVRIWV